MRHPRPHAAGDDDARGRPTRRCSRSAGARRRPGSPSPTLLLLAGDQVYVDATAGLFDPKSQDDRRRNPYFTFFASRARQAVLHRLDVDVGMMLDDHEISDNWEPGDEPAPGAKGADAPLVSGLKAFYRFQRVDVTTAPAVAYESFEHRGLHFFLADTRTERQPRKAGDFAGKLIMSKPQFLKLTSWLIDPVRSSAPKFVLTPSILLPRRLATARDEACGLHSDAWDGYPRSLRALLEWVCEHEVRHLVFLSGDEHLGCDASITVRATAGRRSAFGRCTVRRCTRPTRSPIPSRKISRRSIGSSGAALRACTTVVTCAPAFRQPAATVSRC